MFVHIPKEGLRNMNNPEESACILINSFRI